MRTTKLKLTRPPSPREPEPERTPDYPDEPPAFRGCICKPPFLLDGQIFYAHDPACLCPGHGLRHQPMPPVSVYFRDSRQVGIPKSGRKAIV